MWWPDLGLRNHASVVAQTMMDNIWTLLRYKMMLLLLRIDHYLVEGEFGVTRSQANEIIEWLAGVLIDVEVEALAFFIKILIYLLEHPVSQHLRRLLVSLARNWMSTNERDLDAEWSLDLTAPPIETVSTDVQDPDIPGLSYVPNSHLLPNEDENSSEGSAGAIRQLPLTIGTVAETIDGWAPGVVTQHWNQTLHRVPWLHSLSDTEQATELRSILDKGMFKQISCV
ncbi:hypothetical protein NQZ79_g5875 [Umbelopsis isabellina]|nr:hypothetical protein NQZ79_g5875 [Umbelopsis isabellina]